MAEFLVTRGACHPLYVFEVGFAIDLDRAAQQVAASRAVPRHRERPSGPFEYRPAPLRVTQDLGDSSIHPLALGPAVEFVLYDFGAISLRYTLPLPERPAEILDLSVALRGHGPLLADARERVRKLIGDLGPAIQRPSLAGMVEDYVIFQIVEGQGLPDGATFCAQHAGWIAQVLRAETGELSADEVKDATEARLSFTPTDVTVVDWDSTLILDPEPEDLRAVLEFANVQLLELRYLDDQVDQIVEESYQLLSRRTGWRVIAPSFLAEERRRVSGLQVDSAILLERVTNALKFLGEEYLARLYRLAAKRLHLAAWDSGISRKLATVESIYQKMTDQAANRRIELLEWVIILLIALEVFLTLRGP
ncbi:MAG: hypothetical protein ACT4PM_07485 [Gemmatimonadales bacterium]